VSYFLVDCEARFGVVSPVIEPMTECGAVLFDAPPFATAFHWPKDGSIADFAAWVTAASSGRATFVSDNPAFDWQWVSAEFARAGIANPFGFSARRIGDYAAGLKANFRDANSWKRHRKTAHDHNPVNDARGNAEALWALGVRP
jgi:hypothetical protein